MNRTFFAFACVCGLGIATVAFAATPREILASLTTTSGLYSNQIPDISLPQAYAEVCFVGGSRLVDQHGAGGSTAGGNCIDGDTGFLIEVVERTATSWDQAIETCMLEEMRLPEAPEYMIACRNRAALGITDLGEDNEWSGNAVYSPTIPVFGNSSCTSSGTAFPILDTIPYRCAR